MLKLSGKGRVAIGAGLVLLFGLAGIGSWYFIVERPTRVAEGFMGALKRNDIEKAREPLSILHFNRLELNLPTVLEWKFIGRQFVKIETTPLNLSAEEYRSQKEGSQGLSPKALTMLGFDSHEEWVAKQKELYHAYELYPGGWCFEKEVTRHTYSVLVEGLNGLGRDRKAIYILSVEPNMLGGWEITQFEIP